MSIAAHIAIDGMLSSIRRALRWWTDELRAAWVDATRRLRVLQGDRITIEVGEHQWLVHRGGYLVAPIAGATASGEVLGRLAGTQGADNITVEITPERVLSKMITLPAGASGSLNRIIAFEISRNFPFAEEQVFFGYRVAGRDGASPLSGAAMLKVEIAVVPREVVFAIADDLAAAGLRARCYALMPAAGTQPLPLSPDPLIPLIASATTNRRLLAAVAIAAAVAAISWPLAQQMQLVMLDRDIAAVKPAAETVLRARGVEQRAADQAAAIVALRGSRPPLVGVLDLLTRAVPDGAWLISLSVNGREVILDGLAPSAASIALGLERNPKFSGLSFRSPIARDAATGLEHFRIGVTLAPVVGGQKP